MSRLLFPFVALFCFGSVCYLLFYKSTRRTANPSTTASPVKNTGKENRAFFHRLQNKAVSAKRFAVSRHYSPHIAFLLDMRLHSGQKRFFIYDLQNDSILSAGLVAHGSCNRRFLTAAQFSDAVGCGCSSAGRYRIGGVYAGRFGQAFKLHGLDSTNKNAYRRNVVLHAYDCVPDEEIYPAPICNSLGCTMVSYRFLGVAADYIRRENKPVLLWIYE